MVRLANDDRTRAHRALAMALVAALVAGAGGAQATGDSAARAMARALALLEAGRGEEGEAALESLVASFPDHGPAHFQLGRLALERGAAAAAREHLAAAVALPLPRPYLAWHLLARAEARLGRPEAARRAWEEAARLAARALADRPGDPQALRVAVAAGEARGDWWAALEGYGQLLSQLPRAPALLAGAARAALELGAHEAAACLATRALAATPEDPALHHLLARARLAAGDPAAAAAASRRALELGAAGAAVELTLGRALFETMDTGAAIAAYRRALERDPRALAAVPDVALAALGADDDAALRELLAAVLAADPGNASALYGLGLAAARDGDLAAARTLLERLVDVAPDDSRARYNLARVYARQGEVELGRAAMETFERLQAAEDELWLERNAAFRSRLEAEALAGSAPLDALAIYSELAAGGLAEAGDFLAAGGLVLGLGDNDAAAAWFERILEGKPYHPAALAGLVEARERAGRHDEAKLVRRRLELVAGICAAQSPVSR